jgi:hypothetical protein
MCFAFCQTNGYNAVLGTGLSDPILARSLQHRSRFLLLNGYPRYRALYPGQFHLRAGQ